MKYYKVLNSDGSCANGGRGKWYLPTKKKDGAWKPGKWMPVIEGDLVVCKNGYHLCRPKDLIDWLDEAIFEKCVICGKESDLFKLDFEPDDTDANEAFSRYVCGSCWEVIATISKRVAKNVIAEHMQEFP